MADVPSDLAGLVNSPFRIDDHADILQYDSRQGEPYHGPPNYPTPKGGEFIEYPAHVMAKLLVNDERQTSSVDFLRLVFQPSQIGQFQSDLYPPNYKPVRSTSALALNIWRKKIVMEPGCERIGWGICEEPATNVVILLICWKDPSAQAAGQHLTTTLPVEVSSLLAQEPDIFRFSTVLGHYRESRNPSCFEAVLFYCHAANNDRERFEHYYWHFARTLRPGYAAEHIASAGTTCGGGWSSQAREVDGQPADVYIGLLYWENDAARRQWYEDYSKMSFDDLGWRVEGLRAMAPLGARSYCLSLGDFTKEMLERWKRVGIPFLEGGYKPKGHVNLDYQLPDGIL